MYIEVTNSIFHDEFRRTRPEQFTYAALSALYDHLDDTGDAEQVELDVIAICCDFSQYRDVEEVLQAYRLESREELEENTIVIDCTDGTIIVQNF